MNVRVKANGLLVTLPCKLDERSGMAFVESIRDRLVQARNKAVAARAVLSIDNPLKTLAFEVRVQPSERESLFASLQAGVLSIEYPRWFNTESDEVQRYFWNSINYFLRKEALHILPRKVEMLAAMHQFRYAKVKIQASKTRWGSCSRASVINLSYYLLLLPEHLIDYVILHELCHTREMNHGERFWMWMDIVTDGRSEQLRQELTTHSIPC